MSAVFLPAKKIFRVRLDESRRRHQGENFAGPTIATAAWTRRLNYSLYKAGELHWYLR